MILKLEEKNHWFLLKHSVIALIILGTLFFLFGAHQDTISYMFIILVLYIGPALLLHMEYWVRNRNVIYELNSDKLIENRDGYISVIENTEIDHINIYLMYNLYHKRKIRSTPWEYYHFARITTKSNKQIIITSLLVSDVEQALDELENVKINRRFAFFCSTYLWRE